MSLNKIIKAQLTKLQPPTDIPPKNFTFNLVDKTFPPTKKDNLVIIDPSSHIPQCDPPKIASLLGNFWENILGTTRPHNREATNLLLANYPKYPGDNIKPTPLTEEYATKIIKRNNTSGAGPDGIPFKFYSLMHEHTQLLWTSLLLL